MATLPMAVYGLEVPAGDVAIPAKPDIPAAFRITMAAIDPSAAAEGADGAVPRATLKIIREPLLLGMDDYDEDDEDDSDFDEDQMNALLAEGEDDDSSEEESDEETAAGPSDPAKSKKARKDAAAKQLRKELESEMEIDAPNGVNGTKGHGKLSISEDFDDDDDEDDEDDDDESIDEPEEFVICTLDPTKLYQQTLDITIGEDERVWFKVSGTHTIYLTGNYVEPADPHSHPYDDEEDYDSEDDEDELDYDLSPDEDEIDELSEDELDDMADPRVTEVESEEEVPQLVAGKKAAKADKKGKNKRPAEDSADEATTLDDLIAKSADTAAATAPTNGEPKLSKKQLKKLKNNAGVAVAAEEAPSSAKSDKKVQFAEKLEQGPTPSPAAPAAKTEKAKPAAGPKTINGVTIDDKKLGSGPAAKKGDRIGMRYIGKLKDGKVFDSNKKGKPFTFKLGTGEVIKGWDIGVAGMQVGGERRITVPAHHGYGSKGMPGIPANSVLVFDVKCMEIK